MLLIINYRKKIKYKQYIQEGDICERSFSIIQKFKMDSACNEHISLLMIVQGLLYILYPSGSVSGLVQAAAVGVFTITANLVSLVEVLRYENKKSWHFIVGLIAAIVMIVLGIAMIIAPENITANIQIGIGWILILNAVINIWYIIRLYFASKEAKQEI